MNQHERKLESIKKVQREHVDAYKAIWAKADEEEREPSEEERLEVEAHLKDIEDLNAEKAEVEATLKTLGRVNDISRSLGHEEPEEPKREPARPKAKSLGDQFVNSDAYKALMEKGLRGSSWSTGAINLETKDSPLTEGDNWDVTGTPGDVAPFVPLDQRPGYVPVLYQSLTIADLLGSAQTNSNSVRYVQETTNFSSDNAAASVAEGGPKPESNLSFDQADTPVQKIATFIPITDEALQDAGQIRQVINDRLSLFVRMEEENQLLNGQGSGSDLVGVLDQVPGGNDGVVSDADTPNAADHIYAAITAVRDSFLEADGIVIHPDDWADLRLLKDDNLNYIGGSPFSNTGSNPGESLWGKRVVVTTAQSAGTALVGAFRTGATIYRNGGLTVDASNSHSDYFVKNLTAIRAEERLALAVQRPQAFAVADLSGGNS